MLNKLLPTGLPDIAPEPSPKPIRRSLASLPEPEPLPEELKPTVEKARAVAEHAGFGQSHAPASRRKAVETPAPVTAVVADTGRMMRRSKQTELMSTRVQPETLKFLRDYANAHDMTFSSVVEQVVRDFRAAKGL